MAANPKKIDAIVRKNVLAMVRQNGLELRRAEEFKDDYGIVLAAVTQNGKALKFVSERLRNGFSIILAAVKQNGMALQFASEELKNNYNIILAAVKQNGMALRYASLDNMNINQGENQGPTIPSFNLRFSMSMQVNSYVSGYSYPSSENLRREQIVMTAVKQNWKVLQFSSGDLKDNHEIVLAAVKQNGKTLRFASVSLQYNHEIVLAAVKQNGMAIRYAPNILKDSQEIALAAVTQNGMAIQLVNNQQRADDRIFLASVRQDRRALQHIPKALQVRQALEEEFKAKKSASAARERGFMSNSTGSSLPPLSPPQFNNQNSSP